MMQTVVLVLLLRTPACFLSTAQPYGDVPGELTSVSPFPVFTHGMSLLFEEIGMTQLSLCHLKVP